MKLDLSSAHANEWIRANQALMQVIDPELGINIVDMGLVYRVNFDDPGQVKVEMTLSSPYCPMGDSILMGVERSLLAAFPEHEILIDLVWEPAWSPEMMSEEGRRQLNER